MSLPSFDINRFREYFRNQEYLLPEMLGELNRHYISIEKAFAANDNEQIKISISDMWVAAEMMGISELSLSLEKIKEKDISAHTGLVLKDIKQLIEKLKVEIDNYLEQGSKPIFDIENSSFYLDGHDRNLLTSHIETLSNRYKLLRNFTKCGVDDEDALVDHILEMLLKDANRCAAPQLIHLIKLIIDRNSLDELERSAIGREIKRLKFTVKNYLNENPDLLHSQY